MNAVNSKNLIVIDLLEQIEGLNEIVALHEQSGDISSLKQYIFLRDDFTEKLDKFVAESEIDIDRLMKEGGDRKEHFYSPLLNYLQISFHALMTSVILL